MTASHFQQLRESLLARAVAGEIDREEYERLAREVDLQESRSGSAAASDTASGKDHETSGGRFVSMGDAVTGRGFERRVEPGNRMGDYLLEKRIGAGGMGEIWKARDTVGERDVVIKILPAELAHSPDEIERLKKSFQHVHSLNHEHICPTYALGLDAEVGYYLVLKHLDGGTLLDYRRACLNKLGKFPLKEVVRILAKVAVALDYAHSRKVIHRDIKPENIMVSRDGRSIHVVDFGLAAQIRTSLSRISRTELDTSGTYPYMAPEQWRGAQQDARTDQYALGVLAYELISGHLPFEAVDTYVLRQCVLAQVPEQVAGVPDHVNSALARALAKAKEDRFASCQEFVRHLSGKADTAQASLSPIQVHSDGGAGKPAVKPAEPVHPIGSQPPIPIPLPIGSSPGSAPASSAGRKPPASSAHPGIKPPQSRWKTVEKAPPRGGTLPSSQAGQPRPGAAPVASAAPRRPTAAVVLAVLHLIFGGFGLITIPFLLYVAMDPSGTQGQILFVVIVRGIVETPCLLVGGIGLLRLQPFGRQFSLIYSYAAFAGLAAFALTGLGELLSNDAEPVEYVGAFFGLLIGAIYPGVVLYFMNRLTIRVAYAPARFRAPFAAKLNS